MAEKCVCHINGYRIKDSVAREEIEGLKEGKLASKKEIAGSSLRLYGCKNATDIVVETYPNTSTDMASEEATMEDAKVKEAYNGTVMRRDGNGRASVFNPAKPKHIANKSYVDSAVNKVYTDGTNAVPLSEKTKGVSSLRIAKFEISNNHFVEPFAFTYNGGFSFFTIDYRYEDEQGIVTTGTFTTPLIYISDTEKTYITRFDNVPDVYPAYPVLIKISSSYGKANVTISRIDSETDTTVFYTNNFTVTRNHVLNI